MLLRDVGMQSIDVALHIDAGLLAGTVRYRTSVLCSELRSHGLRVYAGPTYRDAKVHVFFKHFGNHLDAIRRGISGLKIFDITDNHFEGKLAPFYQEMMGDADLITVNSTVMKHLVTGMVGNKAVHMIADPYLYSTTEPSGGTATEPNGGTALFFGHASNFNSLRGWNRSTIADIPIIICSNIPPKGIDWPYKFVPFSVGNLNKCFTEAKIGLVLSSKPWSSANRILDCLVRGIPVIATKTESNREVSQDMKESVRWTDDPWREFDFDAADKELRDLDLGRYSRASIASEWLSLFREYTGLL